MPKKLNALERLHAVQTELTEIHLQTMTPLCPSVISTHLADALYSVLMAQVELLYPDQGKAPPAKREQRSLPELPDRNALPPPANGQKPSITRP
jgi:hypothetical protein